MSFQKDILPPPQQVLMERILCEVFYFLKFAFLCETFFFIIPISIYSSYNLSQQMVQFYSLMHFWKNTISILSESRPRILSEPKTRILSESESRILSESKPSSKKPDSFSASHPDSFSASQLDLSSASHPNLFSASQPIITGQSPDFSARRRRPNLHSNHRRSVSNNRQALLS